MTEEVKTSEQAQVVPENTTPVETSATVETTIDTVPAIETQASGEIKADEPKKESTLLGAASVTTEQVSTETPKESETTEQQVSQSEEPAPLPTYEEFTVPEDFELDKERIGDFTKALAEFEMKTKADHAEVQALGQSFMERHITEVRNSVERHTSALLDAFEQQKSDWREAFEKDPDLGGNRRDTTLNAANEFIKTHGGTPEQQKEVRELFDLTGVGNHPAIIRLLAQAAHSREFTEGKPLPATNPVPMVKNKIEKRYGAL